MLGIIIAAFVGMAAVLGPIVWANERRKARHPSGTNGEFLKAVDDSHAWLKQHNEQLLLDRLKEWGITHDKLDDVTWLRTTGTRLMAEADRLEAAQIERP